MERLLSAVSDIPTFITSIVLALSAAGAGLGWMRSHELRRIAEKQAEANVDIAQEQVKAVGVAVESRAFKLYEDSAEALRASNRAAQEANHYSEEMRSENARLREEQARMHTELDACVAARSLGAANIATLTGGQAELRRENLQMHAEIDVLRRQLVATASASEAKGRDDERANPTGPPIKETP